MIVQTGLGVQRERGGIEMRKCLLTARRDVLLGLRSMPAPGGHPRIDVHDERGRCARKRSKAECDGCARSDRSRNKLRTRPFEPKQTFGHCGIQEKRSARNLLENMTKMNISTSPPRLQIGPYARAGRAVVLFRLQETFPAPAGIAGRRAHLPGSGDCGSAATQSGHPGCSRRVACPTLTER